MFAKEVALICVIMLTIFYYLAGFFLFLFDLYIFSCFLVEFCFSKTLYYCHIYKCCNSYDYYYLPEEEEKKIVQQRRFSSIVFR